MREFVDIFVFRPGCPFMDDFAVLSLEQNVSCHEEDCDGDEVPEASLRPSRRIDRQLNVMRKQQEEKGYGHRNISLGIGERYGEGHRQEAQEEHVNEQNTYALSHEQLRHQRANVFERGAPDDLR